MTTQIDGQQLVKTPAFWTGFLHGVDVGVEKGSPDYTVAHKWAAKMEELLGNAPISTDKAHAETIAQAILDGLQAAAPSVAVALAAAIKR